MVAVAMAATSRGHAQGSYLTRFFQHDAEVITVTDMTEDGRKLREPSKAKPVYYEVLVLGYIDYGRSMAGLQPPDKTAMLKLIVKLLADRGYYPATAKHAPEMLLAVGWGTMNGKLGTALPFMGGDKLDLLWEVDSFHAPLRELTRFMRTPTADLVMEAASGSLYVISIQCFDEAEAIAGRTKLLWHTKVSCPAPGLDMTLTLKQMAREASAYFGRETKTPVWTTTTAREGHVDMGELKILEAIDPAKLPVTEWTGGTRARAELKAKKAEATEMPLGDDAR